MAIALILARAEEVTGMNNKPREVFLPKYAVTACVNEWTEGKHEAILNTMPIHVAATVTSMEPFRHARTFVGRTGLVLRHIYRDVTFCIAIELPEVVRKEDFSFEIPVWAMQGSQLVPFEVEWMGSGDVKRLMLNMFRDHGRYVTGRGHYDGRRADKGRLQLALELESETGELVQDVYNPMSRSKRLSRRVTRSFESVWTRNWTPAAGTDARNHESWQPDPDDNPPDQFRDWNRLREICKSDYVKEIEASRNVMHLHHHGWNPYHIVLPKRSVELALDDPDKGRAERDLWLGPHGFLKPISEQEHQAISLREGGPHRITPDWSFADQHRENRFLANLKSSGMHDWMWCLVTLKQPQMLQWVKEFANRWGEQQQSLGFLLQGCQTRQSGRGEEVTGVSRFLISLERQSLDEAIRYRGLIASIEPAKPGKYIALAFDPSRKKYRLEVFESLAGRDGIKEAKLFAHPITKSKAERVGIPKLYRFGVVSERPAVAVSDEMLQRRNHREFKGFQPFINNRGEGYVEVPAKDPP